MGVAGGAAAGAGAAAIAQAVKASGAIVRVEPDAFLALLWRSETPLVVVAAGGFFSTTYKYLMSYKGLAFYTRSADRLDLGGDVEIVEASQIWVPS